MNKRILFIIILLGSIPTSQGQNNRWIDHFSYLNIHHLQAIDHQIIAQSDNALFTYDLNSGEIEKFSSINGLDGGKISNFCYLEDSDKTLIFYKGGLVEVFDAQKNIHQSPGLQYNSFIPSDKKILNDYAVDNNKIYFATPYGITVYNIEDYEFGDTYYTGNNGTYEKIYSIRLFDNKIFIATENGLKYADKNANLIDFNVWTTIAGSVWRRLRFFNNKLIGQHYRKIYEVTSSGINEMLSLPDDITDMRCNEYLSVSFPNKVKIYDNNYLLLKTYLPNATVNFNTNTTIDVNHKIYIGSRLHGILETTIGSNSYTRIHPNCPLRNTPFSLDVNNNQTWVVYGKHNSYYAPYNMPRGVSAYQEGRWNNIRYNMIQATDICYVKINPANPNIVYLSSAGKGIIKLKNNAIEARYDHNNSPLTYHNAAKVRTFAMAFDANTNLWITEGFSDSKPLFELKNDGSWFVPNLRNIYNNTPELGFSEIIADNKNKLIWLGTPHKGVIGYNPETDVAISIRNGITPAAYTNITAMAIDRNNTMWIGNHESLAILQNPEKAFTDPDVSFKPIKIEFEGSIQLLMNGQNITVIKVDGSNNKWIGTLGGGLYYFSEDGTKTIYHFDKDNSPLPSNDIVDLNIDGKNGIVYIATTEGLIAYKGNATEAGENMDDVYAFPNPVNMQKHDFVTIRGLIEGVSVKIVDVAGNLVYETISKGGSIDWDLTAFGKYKVSSGVYIALITNEDGTQTQTTKILVIK